MRVKLLTSIAFSMLLLTDAYAQDSMAVSKKEMRQQERAERKARLKEDVKDTGQKLKQKAKVANDAVEKGAQTIGATITKGLDKAENAIVTEADKLKAKRDSTKAEKARRDSL